MKELTKIFNGVVIPVEIIDDENIWFDVSEINNANGRRINEWKNSKRVKDILKLHEKSCKLNRSLIDTEVSGKNFIHRKMFVSYARFISVEFEVRADEIIMDILSGNKHLHISEVSSLKEQLQISQKQTKEAKRKTHAYPRNNGFETVTRIIEDHEANITPHDFNEELVKRGIVESFEVPKTYYKAPMMSGVVPLVHVDTAINILVLVIIREMSNNRYLTTLYPIIPKKIETATKPIGKIETP